MRNPQSRSQLVVHTLRFVRRFCAQFFRWPPNLIVIAGLD